uniref:Uncharacterized protein n=1 Tax=Nelumbo nucifera TaxID=4432 RepID=A0A822YUL3_NELNU|nr:TPA_asm: hypothetical protein HUJ06_007013 [Nelumbo nucifera]
MKGKKERKREREGPEVEGLRTKPARFAVAERKKLMKKKRERDEGQN